MSDTYRGTVAIGILHSKLGVNLGTLIRSAVLFDADCVFTVGRRYREQPSAVGHDRHIPVLNYPDVATLTASHPRETVVGVELDPGATPLPAFTHPERALYLLGAEDHGLTDEARAACDRLVTIPAGPTSLNVSVAGSILLYDRVASTHQPQHPDLALVTPGGGE